MPGSNNGGRGPFASALRSLAKQADVKDDEPVDQRAVSAGTSGSNSATNPINLHQRIGNSGTNAENKSAENVAVVSDAEQHRKKANSSPPEKVYLQTKCYFTKSKCVHCEKNLNINFLGLIEKKSQNCFVKRPQRIHSIYNMTCSKLNDRFNKLTCLSLRLRYSYSFCSYLGWATYMYLLQIIQTHFEIIRTGVVFLLNLLYPSIFFAGYLHLSRIKGKTET